MAKARSGLSKTAYQIPQTAEVIVAKSALDDAITTRAASAKDSLENHPHSFWDVKGTLTNTVEKAWDEYSKAIADAGGQQDRNSIDGASLGKNQTFYITRRGSDGLEAVPQKGEVFSKNGRTFGIYKNGRTFVATDIRTGLSIGGQHKRKKDAYSSIDNFITKCVDQAGHLLPPLGAKGNRYAAIGEALMWKSYNK